MLISNAYTAHLGEKLQCILESNYENNMFIFFGFNYGPHVILLW